MTAAIDEPEEKTGVLPKAAVHGGLILLADDHMANISAIGDDLERHAYQVMVVHNGHEAIDKAEAINPNIILMDIQMPMMSGLDAIAHLREDPRFA